MENEEIKKVLIGKIIKDVDVICSDGDNDTGIDSITFTDGTTLELWGRADNAYIGDIIKPCGCWVPEICYECEQ